MHRNKKYKRGYIPKMDEKQALIFKLKYQKKSFWLGSLLPLGAILSIYTSLFIAYSILHNSGIPITLSVTFLFITIFFITRQFRYLENVVHFGSHYNVSKNRRLNDFIINILAAFPTMQTIDGYRKFHRIHHAYFGAEKDPCKIRFSAIEDSIEDFSDTRLILKNIISRLPKYTLDYYKSIGSNFKIVGIWIIWHAAVSGILWSLFGTEFLVFSAVVLWVCFFLLLPAIRYIAEISEHDYVSSDTEYDCTFNNLSIWDFLLFHPGGDAYHLVHHLYPSIPWWLQGKAHRFLCECDHDYRIGYHRSLFLQKLSVNTGVNQ